MTGSQLPADVQLVQWTGKDGFYRARADWFRQIRRDKSLSDRAARLLWEIGDRLSWDRSSAWPSGDTLAAALGCSHATITRSLDDAVKRGWLIRERGGFGKSNNYAMAYSEEIAASAEEDHTFRMERRAVASFPSVLSKMAEPSILLRTEQSFPSELSNHLAQNCASISLRTEQLSNPYIQSSDPEDLSRSDGPSEETVRDESFSVPSVTISELHGLLGEGDEAVGARRAARLSKGRLAYLAEQIELEGIVGAAPDIQSAIRLAITLEKKTKTEVSP